MPYIFIFTLLSFVSVYATSSGPNGPGTATTSGSTSYNWTNPANVLTDNSSAATATISGTNTDGTGTAPLNFTNNGQIFNLRNRATHSLAANFSISGSGSKLVVGDATAAINFTIPNTFTYTGTVDVANNATLTINNTTVPALGVIAKGTLTSYIVFGANGDQTVPAKSYYRLTISGTGTKTLDGASNTEEKLIIGVGATLNDGGYFFSIDADIDNSGIHISPSDGKIMMDGPAAQNISGSNGVFGNLDIFNLSNVTLFTNITINGFLKFSEGELIISAYTLTLNGTTLYETGTLTGGVNANLTVGGTGSIGNLKFTTGLETLNNLTINRTSNGKVTLITTLNVRNILTMTDGNIVNGSNTVTLGSSTASLGTLSHTSGTIAGKFSRWFNNATNTGTTGLFPVGTQDNYRPAQIEYTSAPSTGGIITTEFIASDPGDLGLPLSESGQLIDKAGDSGYWDLATSAVTGGTYSGTFTATNFSGILDYTKLRLIKRADVSSSWTLLGTHVAPTGSNAVPVLTRTGFTSMSQFGIGGDASENPLPVSLLFYTATRDRDVVELQWVTVSEVNSDYFEVEKSPDLLVWESVITVPAAGNSNVLVKYVTEDVENDNKLLYYRLKQVDFDGNTSLFKIVEV
ncbi:MAG: hypothetical protein ABII90_05495 [Bacteroidota bacterium]